jgi:hypothetical protein
MARRVQEVFVFKGWLLEAERWPAEAAGLAAQIAQSEAGGSAGTLVCGAVIDQSFWPVEAAR